SKEVKVARPQSPHRQETKEERPWRFARTLRPQSRSRDGAVSVYGVQTGLAPRRAAYNRADPRRAPPTFSPYSRLRHTQILAHANPGHAGIWRTRVDAHDLQCTRRRHRNAEGTRGSQ